MPHFPTYQDDNLLNEIRAALVDAQHQFREQLCRLLEWSHSAFYENTSLAKNYCYQETVAMLKLFAKIIERLESILIAMCKENGLVYGIQINVNWHKKE